MEPPGSVDRLSTAGGREGADERRGTAPVRLRESAPVSEGCAMTVGSGGVEEGRAPRRPGGAFACRSLPGVPFVAAILSLMTYSAACLIGSSPSLATVRRRRCTQRRLQR